MVGRQKEAQQVNIMDFLIPQSLTQRHFEGLMDFWEKLEIDLDYLLGQQDIKI